MYKLKQTPEDFIVREKTTVAPGNKGRFTYFILEKRNYNTIDALQLAARYFRIPFKRFSFAGNKDKKAVTEQVCSVEALPAKVNAVISPGLKISYFGRGDKPVSLGNLEGNFFEITVRNITKIPKPVENFINFFGEQRFGKNNALIGKALVKKDFQKACLLIDQKNVQDFLRENPANFIAALRKLPKKLLQLYIHSYQSLLWNRTVEGLLKKKTRLPEEAPLIGFDAEIHPPAVRDIIEEVMEKESISFRDFIIKEMPEISSEGGSRKIMEEAKDLKINSLEDDELNSGKKKCRVSFFLNKGCYATEFIKQLF